MTFEKIYNDHWQKVFRLCMGYVNDSDWAKDIAQETFITVWQQLPKFRNESAVGTWIFRIASNQCLRQIEKQKRMPKAELSVQLEAKTDVSNEGKINFLYQCISELNEIERIIISLELEDVKQSEIAEIVGISEANVRVKIHRIKEKLSDKFKQYER
jgi:RNA polymerase sigma-70 factor (ECF subfamily)